MCQLSATKATKTETSRDNDTDLFDLCYSVVYFVVEVDAFAEVFCDAFVKWRRRMVKGWKRGLSSWQVDFTGLGRRPVSALSILMATKQDNF